MATPLDDLTPAKLARIIEDVVNKTRPQVPTNMTVEGLLVTRLLTIEDEIAFTKDANFHIVGGTGESAFANSWTNFGGSFELAGYWKDPFGIVHLRGMVAGGAVNSNALTLPPGYRPAAEELFAVTSNNLFGQVGVLANGQVIPFSPSTNTSVSLSGITFKAP